MEVAKPDVPKKKKKKNPKKSAKSSQKKIIVNAYKNIINESPYVKRKPLLKLIEKRTGIGLIKIKRIISEYRTAVHERFPYEKRSRVEIVQSTSEEDMVKIRRKVHDFWFRREIPNVEKVLESVNNDPDLGNFTEYSLYRLLKHISFKRITCERSSALLDKDDVVLWRQKYVHNIRKYRKDGRPIYYLDETSIFVSNEPDAQTSKVTTSKNGTTKPLPRGKRLIVGHVGSMEGFLPTAFFCTESKKEVAHCHDEMTADTFFTWFRTFLTKLRPKSVIVLDDAPYHKALLQKYPTMEWKKSAISAWLVGQKEQVATHQVKVQLLQLVEKHKRRDNYVINEYAKQSGHTVLRLPPYHAELNPFELVWAKIREYVQSRNTTGKMNHVKQLIIEAIEHLPVESWQQFIQQVTEEEEKYSYLDHITDSVLDKTEEHWADLSEETDNDD